MNTRNSEEVNTPFASRPEDNPPPINLEQFQMLEKVYYEKVYITPLDEEEMAVRCGLTVTQVNNWFEGRRKERGLNETQNDENRESKDINSETEKAPEFLYFYTADQLELFEKAFLITKYPDVYMQRFIALQADVPEQQVQKWFENRRETSKMNFCAHAVFTSEQLEILEQRFQRQSTVIILELQALAAEFGTTIKQVNSWFENRRYDAGVRRLNEELHRLNTNHKNNMEESIWPEGFRSMCPQESEAMGNTTSCHSCDGFSSLYSQSEFSEVNSYKQPQSTSSYSSRGFMMPRATVNILRDYNSRRTTIETLPTLTSKQLLVLEKKYKETKFLSIIDRQNLAFDTDLTLMQVKIWFQNRRVVEKQRMREEEETSSELEEQEISESKEEVESWYHAEKEQIRSMEEALEDSDSSSPIDPEEKKKSTSCGCFGVFSRYVKRKFTRKPRNIAKK